MLKPPNTLVEAIATRVRDSVCSEARGDYHRVTCRAMSTRIGLAFEAPPDAAREFKQTAVDWIALFEARYSRFLPDSIIGQINAHAGEDWMELDRDAEALLSLCDEMYRLSAGIFDPAVLPLLRAWDWKADPPRVPTESEVLAAVELSGWRKVERRGGAIRLPMRGMGIDLGGIGKEFAVDHLVSMAGEYGIQNAMIDIGQDIRVIGHPPARDAWYIGLEEPTRPGDCWTALRLTGSAVATSGDYVRSFSVNGQRYGHVLDPRTGWPVRNRCQAVSVVAPTCVLAGILSTAAFVLGESDGLDLIRNQRGVEACITTETARHQTRGFSSYVPH